MSLKLLVAKGNLRHRIELLGAEKDWRLLSRAQRELRDVAVAQNFSLERPERPSWANGAFIYVGAHYADEVHSVVEKRGVKLQSKHIVASNAIMPTVVAALSAPPLNPDLTSREIYLYRRVSFQDLVWYPSPDYYPHQVDLSALPVG